MKKEHRSIWIVSLLLVFMAFSLISCGEYDDEYWDEDTQSYEQYDDEYSDEYADEYDGEYVEEDMSGDVQESAPSASLAAVDDAGECMDGESYHSENGLCYLDNGKAEPLFASLMDGVTDYNEIEENLLDDEYILVTYDISGDEIYSPSYENVSSNLKAYQDDAATQEMVWEYYRAMIPAEARALLTNYQIVTDGQGGSLAAVEQSPDDPTRWMLNVDIADTKDLRDLTYTLIHEYGHLLTLNENQIDLNEEIFYNPDDDDLYTEAEESCRTYFPGEGCAKSSSYINAFYEEFWADIYAEWSEINYIEDDDAYYEALDNFYYKYEDRFVTDYAATNPGEDIAESWTFFVISKKPVGNTIAEEKTLFFYQYPELVALRDEIVARTYSRMIRMQ